jgi:hypothetical protein
MRYKVGNLEIRSENAAKPMSDAAVPLVDWIAQHDHVKAALDYGCGKMRYTKHIAKKCTSLGIVDSTIQLTRLQRINGIVTTIQEYAKSKWPTCRIYKVEEFWGGIHESYNLILCANVLSVIPCARTRAKSLRSIHTALAMDGELLVVNQHTNSYFTDIRRKPSTRRHLDGWIAQSRKGANYYGILNKDSVIRLLIRYGFRVKDSWIEGQSNYVLVNKG